MIRLALWVVLILMLFAGRANAFAVAVTVKPLHSIVAFVMQGVGTPALLLDGTVSPHTARLKPSTLRLMRSADVFIWVGPGLESFMTPAVADLPASVSVLTATEASLPILLSVRDGQHLHLDQNATVPTDPHLWLDPVNASAIAHLVAAKLSSIDSDNAESYKHNASQFAIEMTALEKFGHDLLADADDQSFILFHDFIQYLEKRFTLSNAGVVTYQPQLTASARHIRELNSTIVNRGVECIISEPQFEGRAIRSLNKLPSVTYTVVDPLASVYEAGPVLYTNWFKDMLGAIHTCLGGDLNE